MLPQPGKYDATISEAIVYEAKSGAVMISFKCVIDEQTAITGHQCVILKDGTISSKTIDRLKETFGWDGQDFFWFTDNIANLPQVSITVEAKENDKGELRPEVSWINKLGDSGSSIKPADRNSIMAKYGSKLRALSGGRPATPPAARPPATPPAPNLPTRNSTMEDCWKALCEHGESRSIANEAIQAAWSEIVNRSGTTQDKMTPAQWYAAKELAETFFIM